MTNEEMTVRIQQGEPGLCVELWKQVKKLVYLMAWRYYTRYQITCAQAGVQLEDLEQAAYLTMLDTVKAYKPESGYKFTTYLHRHLLNRWGRMLDIRTGRESFDPLNRCTSLELPIGPEDDSSTVADVVPDKDAELELDNVTEQIYTSQLCDMLESCLATLERSEADTLRRRYFYNEKLKDIAIKQERTIDQVRTLESNGLRKLRQSAGMKRLKSWR